MKLSHSTTSPLGQPGFEYHQQPWGDLIHGTREQLQSIGIAVGMAFPGEPGRPTERRITVTDPRGFPCRIEPCTYKAGGIYTASILFPGRGNGPEKRWIDCASGVRKCSDSEWGDEYIGTADALADAGLVRVNQLPGQPGMRKVRVTIYPDGTAAKGATSNRSEEARMPGAKRIDRASKSTYRVRVIASEKEQERRDGMSERRNREWEARMLALPRPAPLVDLPDAIGRPAKAKPVPKYDVSGNVIRVQFPTIAERRVTP